MKICAIVLAWLAFANAVHAQKENNVWVGGSYAGIDFNSGLPVLFERNSDNFWRTNASVCDSGGNLLFYTNGFRIYNKDYSIMPNGDNLEIGDYVQFGYNLLAIADGAVIIPKVEDAGKYYIFHTDINWMEFDTLGQLLMPTHLFYCVVDVNLNGGLGDVVAGQKDISILNDTITKNGMKAVKHANGRDYWLITHEAGSDLYYRFLIDPYGIHGPYTQKVGMPMQGEQCLGFSALVFRKDGLQAVQLASKLMLIDVYDFDRCSGMFTVTHSFSVSDTANYLSDAEYSALGRYLYVSVNYRTELHQFDMQATDIASSQQLVGVVSDTTNPFYITFERLRLAPDDKIYIASYDGNQSLSVINHPDSAGTACGFVEVALELNPPGYGWSGMPNVVNYSLGALVGSPCDTLVSATSVPVPAFTFGVYPNPFNSELQLSVTGLTTKAFLSVTNVLGQRVLQQNLSPHDHAIQQVVDMSGHAAGVYMITLDANGQRHSKVVTKH